jgi:Ca2+-binding RTX toxin-like protein
MMMAGTATIVGGALVDVRALTLSEQGAAQAALTALGKGYGFSSGAVLDSLGTAAPGDALTIYQLGPTSRDESFTLRVGGQGLVVTGNLAAKITGLQAHEVLIGNAGNDTIDAAGGSGTVIAGGGHNKISTGGTGARVAELDIVTGAGTDNINLTSGKNWVHVGGGAKINSTTDATVFGGTGSLIFNDMGTGNDSVVAGSGHSTLRAGTGDATFVGGAHTQMFSSTGNDTFIGGRGEDAMRDMGQGHTVFQFDSAFGGGHHLVFGFSSTRDSIHLNGYSTNTFLNAVTVHGGSSFVRLQDGTTVEFVGVTHLTKSDFK